MQHTELLKRFHEHDYRALARCISIVENEMPGYDELLFNLKLESNTPVIGITGPPGAGKSTLVNALITRLSKEEKRIGVIAVDPTSPFNFGSILGDRIRMGEHFNNPNVYIRSLATRGSLGGLSAKILEVVDIMKEFGFDYIIVETVGVGQSEVEIAGLADTTVLVLVPEAGDEVQTLKSGVMEIADIFVVNKSDRPDAGVFLKNIHMLLHERKANDWNVPVVKAIATSGEGVDELIQHIHAHNQLNITNQRKPYLLAEKALRLIQTGKMKGINKAALIEKINNALNSENFNVYRFVKEFL